MRVIDTFYTLVTDAEARNAEAVERQLSENISTNYYPWFDK